MKSRDLQNMQDGASKVQLQSQSHPPPGTSNQQRDPLFPSGKVPLPEYRDGKAIQ
jgi:hypothetical protein